MPEKFKRPIDWVHGRDEFSETEVGITHPDNNSFIRIRENGDIEIMAGEGLGIILSPSKKTINLVGDNVKFLTKKTGLRWNEFAFNDRAVGYQEPTFLQTEYDEVKGFFEGVEHYLVDEDDSPDIYPAVMITDPQTGEEITWLQYYNKYRKNPPMGDKNG
ncbi:MAG TPA: hypothetical protein VJ742_12180 [Nitrososphaera sp.]|nr:hypothetical protein [Nitrososphaera sp.]